MLRQRVNLRIRKKPKRKFYPSLLSELETLENRPMLAAILFNPTGTGSAGALEVLGIDYAVGNTLARGYLSGPKPTYYYQAASVSLLTSNGQVPLMQRFSVVAQFTLGSAKAGEGVFRIYTDTNSSDLEGTGFDDERLILAATVASTAGGVVTSPTGQLQDFDQVGRINYYFNEDGEFVFDPAGKPHSDEPGTISPERRFRSITALGSATITAFVDYTDPNYFVTLPNSIITSLFLSSPFESVEPAASFSGWTPKLGKVNGVSGPDFQLQVDGTSSFTRADPLATGKRVAEAEPNNTFKSYQPLNGITGKERGYTVDGSIAALSDVDYYAFYASKGSEIVASAWAKQLTGDLHTEFDPVLGLYEPSGKMVGSDDDGGRGFGSFWASRLSVTAPRDGVYRIAISHYNNFAFDGANNRPSYNPDLTESGPGVHIGSYSLTIMGAQKPEIRVFDIKNPSEIDKSNPSIFKIDGNAEMPTIPLRVIGIAPEPESPIRYIWEKEIQLLRGDVGSQKVEPDWPFQKTVFRPETIIGTSDYIPKFQGLSRGGNLTLSVKTVVAGVPIELKRDNSDPFKIYGTLPTTADVLSFIASLGGTPSLALGAVHDFGRIIQAIIKHESGENVSLVEQFIGLGVPKFSRSGDGGGGLMQLSLANANLQNLWNWKQNIRVGVSLLAGNLSQARRHFQNERNKLEASLPALAKQHNLNSVTIAMPTAEELLLNAISLFGPTLNGRKTRYYHEYDGNDGVVVVTPNGDGTGTIYLRTIESSYVNSILEIYGRT